MSYVSENKRGNPVGMGAAILVNGSIILAVALSPIVAEYVPGPTIITGTNIEDKPPPPPDKPMEKQKTKKADPIFAPERAVVFLNWVDVRGGNVRLGAARKLER